MSKFKFRMATLLRLRETTRDQRRGELAEAYRVDEVLQRQLQQIQGDLTALRLQCRSAVGPGEVNVDRLVEAQRYEVALLAQQQQVVRQREQVQNEIQRRRQILVEANREVHVLESLRDKQADRHRQEEDRRDMKRLDEVAQQQSLREVAQ
jgi:flagellar FliJ protein